MRESKFIVKRKLVQTDDSSAPKIIVNNTVFDDNAAINENAIKVRSKRFDYKFKLNMHLYDDNVETVEQIFLDYWDVPVKPRRQGYKFLGWYVDDEFQDEFDVHSQCDSIITDIYANWEVNNDPFEVDLNYDNWQPLQSWSYDNDDFEIYESCYGHENYNSNPCVMYINVSGVRRFTIWINSYDEYNSDYTAALEADDTYFDSYTYEYAKGHTIDNQINPSYYGSIDSDAWVKVTYELDGGDHVIAVGFIDNGGDPYNYGFKRGFVAIPHEDYNDASTFTISGIDKKYPMTGSQIIPNVVVTDAFGKALTKGVDYSMVVSNNVGVGKATVTITGMGKYHGSVQSSFRIYDPSVQQTFNVWWNDEDWMEAEAISFDGYEIYQSNTVDQDDTQARLYIDVSGRDSLELYINSYAESSYDYTVAMYPDYDYYDQDYGEPYMETTQDFQYDPSYGVDEYNWKRVYYELNGQYNYVCIIFRKDGSVGDNWDCGFVAIPTDQ